MSLADTAAHLAALTQTVLDAAFDLDESLNALMPEFHGETAERADLASDQIHDAVNALGDAASSLREAENHLYKADKLGQRRA